jgi:hypothetical protein
MKSLLDARGVAHATVTGPVCWTSKVSKREVLDDKEIASIEHKSCQNTAEGLWDVRWQFFEILWRRMTELPKQL